MCYIVMPLLWRHHAPAAAAERFKLVGQAYARITRAINGVDGGNGEDVRRLASGPPLAFAATKKAVNAATLVPLEDALERERTGQVVLMRTADVAEGMRAFSERRKPVFRGE